MQKDAKYKVHKEGRFFVVLGVNVNLASQGKTKKEAVKNFHEAYELLNDGK